MFKTVAQTLTLALSLATAFLVLLACSPKKSSSGGGVVDGGGGGDLRLHNREEAIREIEKAWRLLVTTRPDNPLQVGMQYLDWKEYAAKASWNRGKPLTPTELKAFEILKKMFDGRASRPAEKGFGRYVDTPLTTRLKDKKVNLLEQGLCRGPSHSGHVASVSKLDLSGELCVSIPEVQKIPYAGVTSTPLIALLIHEIAHLHGYGEADAQLIQEFFLHNMTAIVEFRAEQRKRRIAAQAEQKVRKWRQTITYGAIDDMYLQALQSFAADIYAIRESLPAPYTLESMRAPDPDGYEKVYRMADEIAVGYSKLTDRLNNARKRNRNLKMSAASLARLRELGIASFRLLDEVNKYLFGSDKPMELAVHELDTEQFPLMEKDVIEATDPKRL